MRDEGQTDREALLGVHPQSGPVLLALSDGEREKGITVFFRAGKNKIYNPLSPRF